MIRRISPALPGAVRHHNLGSIRETRKMLSLASCAKISSRLRKFGFVMALVLPSSIMLAQSPVPKIATVSFTDAVMQTNEAQRDFGELQSKFAPRQAKIDSLSKEVDNLRKVLSDSQEKLSDTERNSRIQTLSEKEKQLQREEEDYRNDSQSEGQTAFQLIAKKVFDFLQEYARQRGYSVVIERGSDTSPIVWYTGQDIDITTGLISAYNTKSEVPPPGATTHAHPTQPPDAPTPARPRQ